MWELEISVPKLMSKINTFKCQFLTRYYISIQIMTISTKITNIDTCFSILIDIYSTLNFNSFDKTEEKSNTEFKLNSILEDNYIIFILRFLNYAYFNPFKSRNNQLYFLIKICNTVIHFVKSLEYPRLNEFHQGLDKGYKIC